MNDGSDIIPLFPLEILLLPSEQLPLHIFEPKYRQLVREAELFGIKMGLPFVHPVASCSFVSICKLLRVTKRYCSGESDVVIECERVSSLIEFHEKHEGKLYPVGKFGDRFDEVGVQTAPAELMTAFSDYVEYKYGTRPGAARLVNYTIMDIAASTAMSNEDKVKLLLLESDGKRTELLIKILKYLRLLYLQESKAEYGILMN